jgi:hypothetical protein
MDLFWKPEKIRRLGAVGEKKREAPSRPDRAFSALLQAIKH